MYNPDIHGMIIDGVLKEENRIIQDTTPQDRMKMMLGTMDGLFGEYEKIISDVLQDILATYELDEGYIFTTDLSKSYYGFRRTEDTVLYDQNSVSRIVENVADISFVTSPDFDKLFNSNGALVIDSPEFELSGVKNVQKFFLDKGIRHAFFYKMGDDSPKGYVVFYNTRQVSRKFAQQDVTDFTYLGKMIEIALKSR